MNNHVKLLMAAFLISSKLTLASNPDRPVTPPAAAPAPSSPATTIESNWKIVFEVRQTSTVVPAAEGATNIKNNSNVFSGETPCFTDTPIKDPAIGRFILMSAKTASLGTVLDYVLETVDADNKADKRLRAISETQKVKMFNKATDLLKLLDRGSDGK